MGVEDRIADSDIVPWRRLLGIHHEFRDFVDHPERIVPGAPVADQPHGLAQRAARRDPRTAVGICTAVPAAATAASRRANVTDNRMVIGRARSPDRSA